MEYREFFDWGYIAKTDGDKIIIYGRNIRMVFNSDIGLILSGKGSITSNVFRNICRNRGDLFFDKIGYRVFYNDSPYSILMLRQIEKYFSKDRFKIAIEILKAAARSKIKLLNLLDISSDVRENAVGKISDLINTLRGEFLSSLMGVEATITKIYLEAVSTIIPERYGFKGRTRRPPEDPFNAAISYGNMFLYRFINRCLLKYGFDPRISFLHQPYRYRYSLALDISEMFRQVVVDISIIPLYTSGGMVLNRDFRKEGSAVYLSKSGGRKVLRAINHRLNLNYRGRRLMDWIIDQILMLKRYLLGIDVFKPFIFE